MTIKECIDIVDNIKPNQYTIKEKVMWLSFIDEIIINEVLKTHEGYDGSYDDFEGYMEDKLSVSLIVPSPYDRLYTAYLKMKIDQENGETARYNNSAVLYNSYMSEYRKHYNKTHMPLTIGRRDAVPPRKVTSGLSDAEYENLKKDLTFILTEYFSDTVSADKISAIVTNYVQTNAEMLKGKNGYTPIKGVDYFTEDDIEKMRQAIKGDLLPYATKDFVKQTLLEVANKITPSPASITLYADRWKQGSGETMWYQEIVVANATVTPNSKVDLQPSPEQLYIFHEKDIAFVAENDEGKVTIFCIGQKPMNDYTIQVTVTEVVLNA